MVVVKITPFFGSDFRYNEVQLASIEVFDSTYYFIPNHIQILHSDMIRQLFY